MAQSNTATDEQATAVQEEQIDGQVYPENEDLDDVMARLRNASEPGVKGPIHPGDVHPDADENDENDWTSELSDALQAKDDDDGDKEGKAEGEEESREEEKPKDEAAENEGDDLIKRFSTKAFDERTQRIMDFMARNRDDAPKLEDASAYVDARYPHLAPKTPTQERTAEKSVTEATQQQTEQAQAEAPVSIEAITAEIDSISEKMEKASEDFDMKAYHKLNRELLSKQNELHQAQLDEVRGEAAAEAMRRDARAQVQTAERESETRAVGMFPDVAQEGSELYTAVQLDIQRLERTNPQFFDDPEWPETLAAKNAAKLGISPVTTQTQTVQKTGDEAQAEAATKKAPPATARRPAPPSAGRSVSSSVSAKADASERESLAKRLRETEDPEDLIDFLKQAGTRSVA
jgi:hypothetical protein